MFKPPSLQREFTLACSFDPALDLPVLPAIDLKKATPDELAVIEKITKERAEKFKLAYDSGRWDQITKSGESLTLFHVRSIHGPGVNWLRGEATRHQREMHEMYELAFRLGVKGVDNLGAIKLSPKSFETVDGHHILTMASVEMFTDIGRDDGDAELGPAIVQEIGTLLLERALEVVRPLS